MNLRVRAPATTANLGPGFDCAGAALDLWNEVEIGDRAGPRVETTQSPTGSTSRSGRSSGSKRRTGSRFAFTDRIPRERGLGSSAATVALGLVAGALVAGREPDPEELLRVGVDLEGHPDNLAAALAGGVCLTWDGTIARIAERLPAEPSRGPERACRTAEPARSCPTKYRMPTRLTPPPTPRCSVPAIASGSASCSRPHSRTTARPYRAANAPVLGAVRAICRRSALGATISGSGPTVIVWARPGTTEDCASALAASFPAAQVLPLSVATKGAEAF